MICRGRGTKNVWNHVFIQVSIEMKAVELWTLTKHNSNGSKRRNMVMKWAMVHWWGRIQFCVILDGDVCRIGWKILMSSKVLIGQGNTMNGHTKSCYKWSRYKFSFKRKIDSKGAYCRRWSHSISRQIITLQW